MKKQKAADEARAAKNAEERLSVLVGKGAPKRDRKSSSDSDSSYEDTSNEDASDPDWESEKAPRRKKSKSKKSSRSSSKSARKSSRKKKSKSKKSRSPARLKPVFTELEHPMQESSDPETRPGGESSGEDTTAAC